MMKHSFRKSTVRRMAILLCVVLAVSVVAPYMTQIFAEEADPLSRIYDMLTGTVGEPETAEEYAELADISIGKREYEQALAQLEQARALTDAADGVALGELWLRSASVYVLQGDYDQAEGCIDEALNCDPEASQALLLRAQLAIAQEEYARAVSGLEAYLELEQDADAMLSLAQLYESLGRYADAKAQYEALYALDGENEAHMLNAVRCGFLNGEYEQTIAFSEEYLADQTNTDAQLRGVAAFLGAACHMQLGRYEEAIAGFEVAVEEGYDAATCYEQMFLCSFDAQDFEGAVRLGEKMESEGYEPASPDVFAQRMGASLLQLERYEEALTYLDAAVEYDTQLPGSQYYRGVSLLALGRYEEAREAFTLSIEQEFLLQYCYYNRGVCNISLLDYDAALDDFEQTLAVADDAVIIEAAKDVLWQLAAYYESQAPIEQTPEMLSGEADAQE